ncbi:MAG: PhoH family protein [Chitinophagales bacterium]|nr:PhoH family protein [Chitinophagales bacterium]MDW8392610.1 PhoH family protein [Chitinophagales bacterium]
MKDNRKIFVLDTSVILYDYQAIKNFQEHDVVIPITVLEELDQFKKGNDEKNFAAREFIRFVDKASGNQSLQNWTHINGRSHGCFRIVMGTPNGVDADQVFGEVKPDHRILNSALQLQKENPNRRVVLVSKDINLRIKAKALNLIAEDYETGKTRSPEELYTGVSVWKQVPPAVLNELYQNGSCRISLLGKKFKPQPNHFYVCEQGGKSLIACYNAATGRLELVKKRSAFRIMPRNVEQICAMEAILNPNINLVTLQGVAGTGKTLLSLAGALEQRRNYHQIYLARPVVPLSNKDIGYLPGDIKSKLNPYMEPLWDNLKYIRNQYSDKEKEHRLIGEMVENEKLVVCPLAYIRGRSFSNVFFIVDEAQNLTPHEVKTIISRGGENTKMVFTGDIHQIDTPYLDARSNGLSYLIERAHGNHLYAHVTLQKGERSELANLANELL